MVNVWGSNSSDLIHIAGDGGSVTGTRLKDVPLATDGNDVIYARDGDDVIRGGGGVDVAYGGIGDDAFILRAASDLAVGEGYYGGDGMDWLDGGAVSGPVSLDGIAVWGVEGLYGFGDGLSLHASTLSQMTRVNTGTLTLLDGGTVDLSRALVATTRFVFSDQATTLNLLLDPDSATGFAGFHGTIIGGAGADRVNVWANSLDLAHPGPVTIRGGGGNDLLSVDAGPSKIFGNDGDDSIFVGTGAIGAYGGRGRDLVKIGLPGAGEVLSGGDGQDTLSGYYGAVEYNLSTCLVSGFETISGFMGEVVLTSAQASRFSAINLPAGLRISDSGVVDLGKTHVGAMRLTLNEGSNLVTLASWAKSHLVTVDLGAGNDLLQVIAPTGLSGLRVDVSGGGGDDTIIGGFASDTLTGGAGDDVLSGGRGKDAFLFSAGHDTITDFSGLRSLTFGDRIGFIGGASPSGYLGDGAFTGTGYTEVRFDGTALSVDLTGDGVEDMTLTLTGMTAASDLTGADFY